MFRRSDHTFAVCAYKESPYLRECIESLVNQSVKTNIIIATSTDNEYIRNIADEYKIKLFVSDKPSSICGDWNFAYDNAPTKLVTLAHQDDVYEKNYARDMLEKINKAKNPLIYFTNYQEIRDGRKETGTMVKIKRIMLIPLKPKFASGWKFAKRLAIRMGNPVLCPSVTYVRAKMPNPLFESDFRSNLDWEQWEKFSKKKGQFIYDKKVLTYHRVHEGSETSNTINNGNIRAKEDYQMFLKFWPKCIAKFIMKFYIKAEKFN